MAGAARAHATSFAGEQWRDDILRLGDSYLSGVNFLYPRYSKTAEKQTACLTGMVAYLPIIKTTLLLSRNAIPAIGSLRAGIEALITDRPDFKKCSMSDALFCQESAGRLKLIMRHLRESVP